jgi:hypothetical protein
MLLCTSATLPSNSNIKRDAPRPVEFRPSGYEEEFDALTLFYDAFAYLRGQTRYLVLVGPPLLNLGDALFRAKVGRRHFYEVASTIFARDRCCDIWISNWTGATLQLDGDLGHFQLTPQTTAHDFYSNRRVLFTLSKNNELAWIADWIKFHSDNHGANAVLIYDNESTKYTAAYLENSMRRHFPRMIINVLNWPYPYGPGGYSKDSGWDSDFCQAGAFQDARFRFLAAAASVLNCDVDEFVVSAAGKSIFDATEKSAGGYIAFGGRWVSTAVRKPLAVQSGQPLRHGRFTFLEREGGGICPLKWCVVPSQCNVLDQWRTHSVAGKNTAKSTSPHFSYRHFRAISTNWKYPRAAITQFDIDLHEHDENLRQAFERSGI